MKIADGIDKGSESYLDIIDISKEEWKAFSQEINHSISVNKRMIEIDYKANVENLLICAEKVQNGEIVSEYVLEVLNNTSISEMREISENPNFNQAILDLYKSRIAIAESILLKASFDKDSNEWKITGISHDEWNLLILILNEKLMSYKSIVENYNHKAQEEIKKLGNPIFGDVDVWSDHPELIGIEDNSEYRLAKYELCEGMIPIIELWLLILNPDAEEAFEGLI